LNSALSRRKGVLLLSLMAVLLALLVGHFLWTGVHTHSVHAIRTRVDDWQPLLTGIRWMVLGTLALVWPQLCCWWGRAGDPDDDRARQLMELRWRILGWLVAIELILGQGVLVKAMAVATGHSP
jgi:drug/metabolite transporter (DMT)-like permease